MDDFMFLQLSLSYRAVGFGYNIFCETLLYMHTCKMYSTCTLYMYDWLLLPYQLCVSLIWFDFIPSLNPA